MERPVPDANRPRVEPEIIPPGRAGPRPQRGASFDGRDTQRIYVAQVGPFGFAMVALVVALVLALVFLLLLGAFVVFIPLAGALLAAAVLLSLFRGAFRRRY
ncbi:MAG: hypothetical protein ACXU9A_14595 [Xanthobacteraceae bacterium]|jgi:hypothetical protein